MIKKLNFIYLLLFGLIQIQCTGNSAGPEMNENAYLVFGQFYGECAGESCVEIFKIEDNHLYEDTLDTYPIAGNLPHAANFVQLSNEKYEKTKHLPELIPPQLFSEKAVVIGQPDAGDWGGFYLETNEAGNERYWLIDKMKSNIPEFLHTFVDSLDSAIQMLQ